MGQPISCSSRNKKSLLTEPELEEVDIQGFYKELKSNPGFNGRFETVPLSRILLMANEILVFLAHVIRNGRSPRPWVEIFDLHSVMFITETEIEALFRVFFREFYVEIKRNPILRNTFRKTSPSSLSKM